MTPTSRYAFVIDPPRRRIVNLRSTRMIQEESAAVDLWPNPTVSPRD